MSDIFISYAREDREKAKALAEVFQTQGWSVWWDRKIPPGKSFDQVIEEALAAAKCVVVLWSKTSAASDWVKGEAGEGLARGVLVPLRIEEVKVPLEFRRLQTVDLAGWDGDPAHAELGGFLEAVAGHIKGTVRPPEVTAKPRRSFKPVLVALLVLALLLAAFIAYRSVARKEISPAQPVEPPHSSPAVDMTPTYGELRRTPRLGLEFWQRDQKSAMFAGEGEKFECRVLLKPLPFEIRLPRFEGAVQICAWSDDSICDAVSDGKKTTEIPFFSPGTGMADAKFGYSALRLSNRSHNYIADQRTPLPDGRESIFFSRVVAIDETKPSAHPSVYLVIFFDFDQDAIVSAQEFECLRLEFAE